MKRPVFPSYATRRAFRKSISVFWWIVLAVLAVVLLAGLAQLLYGDWTCVAKRCVQVVNR